MTKRDREAPDQLSPEITFTVKPHPHLRKVGGGVMAASLKITGSLGLSADLQAGDVLTVTVADADGLVVTEGLVEVGSPGFKTLTLQQTARLSPSRRHANLARPTFSQIVTTLKPGAKTSRHHQPGKAIAAVVDALVVEGAVYHDGSYKGGPIFRLRPDPVPPSAEVALEQSRYLKKLRGSGPATVGELARWGDSHQALVADELSRLERHDPPLVRKGPGGKYTATVSA